MMMMMMKLDRSAKINYIFFCCLYKQTKKKKFLPSNHIDVKIDERRKKNNFRKSNNYVICERDAKKIFFFFYFRTQNSFEFQYDWLIYIYFFLCLILNIFIQIQFYDDDDHLLLIILNLFPYFRNIIVFHLSSLSSLK